MTLAVRRLYSEAQEFVRYLGENVDMIRDAVGNFTDKTMSFPTDSPLLQELGEVGEKIGEWLSTALADAGEKGSAVLASVVGKIAMGTPKAVVGTVVAVVSSFYLCCDLENIKNYLLGFLGEESQRKVREMISRVLGGIKAYAVAYFWLFVITFVELYLGLFLLGRRYALLLALLLALVDMLPLFGAGVFVVPWGIFLILNGDTANGVGLFILLGVMSITRQIVEPRLVGKKLGIHPLASLASMYVGFRIFGFWGMILAPVAVLVVKEMRKAKEQGSG
jgi:sporulation integral membrane protein YtvI